MLQEVAYWIGGISWISSVLIVWPVWCPDGPGRYSKDPDRIRFAARYTLWAIFFGWLGVLYLPFRLAKIMFRVVKMAEFPLPRLTLPKDVALPSDGELSVVNEPIGQLSFPLEK